MTKPDPIFIGKTRVGEGEPCFVIAEIGINHNGDMELAKSLIDVAVTAGANAVKFQTRTVDVVYTPEELAKPRPVPRHILEKAIERCVLPMEAIRRLENSNFENSTNGDLKRLLEFTDDEYHVIDAYCKARSIMWTTSCWDVQSLRRMLTRFDLPFHKIASACNEDDELLTLVRDSDKPIIMSTGMTTLKGVEEAVAVTGNKDLILLHCTSVYPQGTDVAEKVLKMINLKGMETLRTAFSPVPIGFSSHDSGIQPSYAAAVLGAVVVEKHITMERGMWGSDQSSSVEPGGFTSLCRMVKELPIAMGDGEIEIYPDEVPVANKLRRVRRSRSAEHVAI